MSPNHSSEDASPPTALLSDQLHSGSTFSWSFVSTPNLTPSRAPHPETLLAAAGCGSEDGTGAVTPPVHFSTTFERAVDGNWPGGHIYSRDSNPTRCLFEEALAELEGAARCAAFASGMAAANAAISALCGGGHLIIPHDIYHGVRVLAETVWRSWGLEVSTVDYSGDWLPAVRKDTRLIWVETPSNPRALITDVAAVCGEARKLGIPTLVDSTWNTPLIMRPVELGADYVMHSTTKFLGGHSDVLGGALLAASDSGFETIREVQKIAGAVMDPFSAWLTLRGMRSLAARLERQCRTAERVAAFLDAHPAVTRVYYPGLTDHPGHEIAAREMTRFGAMMSFEVPGLRPAAMSVAGRLKVFQRATSLGGTESLVEHRASIEPEPPVSPEGLLRLSIGLEHEDDLLADLDQALSASGGTASGHGN